MAAPRALKNYDKRGCKILISDLKRILFSDCKRVTKELIEEFFDIE